LGLYRSRAVKEHTGPATGKSALALGWTITLQKTIELDVLTVILSDFLNR